MNYFCIELISFIGELDLAHDICSDNFPFLHIIGPIDASHTCGSTIPSLSIFNADAGAVSRVVTEDPYLYQ